MERHITLTSKAGRFIFYSDVLLSHAKLIRDMVGAQVVNPQPRAPRIKSSSDARNYVRASDDGAVSDIPFSFVPSSVRR